MDLPKSLPDRIFLLAYDPARRRLVEHGRLGYLVRAAALIELYLTGHITDHEGRPRATSRAHPADPLLASVLKEIAQSRPRRWSYWVRAGARGAYEDVRDRLAQRQIVRLERGKMLWLIPVIRVRMPDSRVAKHLAATAGRVLRGAVPPNQIDKLDGALVALAAAGELSTAFGWRERRAHRARIRQLTAEAGPAATAVARLIRNIKATAASASAGG